MADGPRPVAIVTGASGGIGRATALALARAGHALGITYNSDADGADETLALIRATGVEAGAVRLDLADPRRAAAALAELRAQLGTATVLVNNAGANRRASAQEETVDGFDATLAVNLVGPWACARAFVAPLLEAGRPGRIVNVTSILATVPLAEAGAYCAAKAGLDMLTKVMAIELAPHGIAVNAVAPGHTATRMNFAADALTDAPIARPVIPLGRAAAADEVAAAIAFLATDAGSYATGTSLLVDGGLGLVSGPGALQDAVGLPPEDREVR